MTMTSSENKWIARVMHTISYVAFMESCNILAEEARNDSARRRTELHPNLETEGAENP
jgi:hypothetical protein